MGTVREIYIPFGRGTVHLISILEELAQISYSDQPDRQSIADFLIGKGIKTERGCHLSFLVPSMDMKLRNRMELLNRRGHQIQMIVTGGESVKDVPSYCRQYMLSEYGKEYFV